MLSGALVDVNLTNQPPSDCRLGHPPRTLLSSRIPRPSHVSHSPGRAGGWSASSKRSLEFDLVAQPPHQDIRVLCYFQFPLTFLDYAEKSTNESLAFTITYVVYEYDSPG